MRFLLDESADERLIGYLEQIGHDVTAIGRDHPPSLDDASVLAIAHREGRILITGDRDFGELVFVHLQPHAGVIYLRIADDLFPIKLARLHHVLANHADDLERFIVVTERTVRVR